jgi:hypothetical protein
LTGTDALSQRLYPPSCPEEVSAASVSPDEEFDAPVVACSELSSNEGASVTYTADQRLAVFIRPARQHEGPTLSPREGGRQFLVEIQLTSSLLSFFFHNIPYTSRLSDVG